MRENNINEYLEYPCRIEDTIENLKAIKVLLQKKLLAENYEGMGKKDSAEIGFDFDRALKALEKQIPNKPIIKAKEEVPHTHDLGRLLSFHCPNCGRFIVGLYEKDVKRGGGISISLKGCSSCLQAIDFSEYYTKREVENNKLDEDIEWSE